VAFTIYIDRRDIDTNTGTQEMIKRSGTQRKEQSREEEQKM
jgi:hypothetical protein